MVNLRNSFLVILMLTGCASREGMLKDMADEYASGKHDADLISVIAFDTGCEKEKIKIVSRKDDAGSGLYNISACEKKLKYKRTGSIFHSADKPAY